MTTEPTAPQFSSEVDFFEMSAIAMGAVNTRIEEAALIKQRPLLYLDCLLTAYEDESDRVSFVIPTAIAGMLPPLSMQACAELVDVYRGSAPRDHPSDETNGR